MKKLLTIENFTSAVFYLAILIFIIGFNFTDAPPPSGWYQQFMPNLNGASLNDITFTDSSTGFAVTTVSSNVSYILKTSNGGDNWSFIRSDTGFLYNRVQFINQNTGFVGGFMYTGTSYYLLKTTDCGLSWFYINAPFDIAVSDMYVLNNDTLWLADNNTLVGGVFRTTNGGQNWSQQLNLGSQNPTNIYFYNGNIGFIAKNTGSAYIRKTTNGGLNWDTIITGAGGFLDMYFVDSLIGWKTNGYMQKTTNGGFNWISQILPSGGIIITSGVNKFSNINRDTIWGAGGWVQYPNFQSRGLLYRTINGGDNWLFQVPDTSINIFQYYQNKFVNKIDGWAYSPSTGVHTTTGGDPVFYTGTKQISSNTPNEFKLFQNYPNPFNTSTRIVFHVKQITNLKLVVYDITGKEITILADKVFEAGTYEITFDGTNYSSGIYFYSLFIDNLLTDSRKMILIK